MIDLLLASRNRHKLEEVAAILGEGFRVRDLSVLPAVPPVEETGDSYEENAGLKAVAVSLHDPGWVVADDSGLEVDALGGGPGIRSARYAGGDAANNALLLRNLGGEVLRTARFRCVIVLARAGHRLASFGGVVEGRIARAPRGTAGFGYDPLFVPEGHTQSFAELSPEIKNQFSHRARALAGLKGWAGFR